MCWKQQQAGSLIARHPFLYAQAPDLLLHFIPDLLACYKVEAWRNLRQEVALCVALGLCTERLHTHAIYLYSVQGLTPQDISCPSHAARIAVLRNSPFQETRQRAARALARVQCRASADTCMGLAMIDTA